MTRRFALTFDYLCPFARNANEHVITALRGGADWDVRFVPYSLAQGHGDEERQAVWDRPDPHRVSGVLALQVGIAVRDRYPDRFLDVHEQLFAARHDRGEDLKAREVVGAALERAGLAAEDLLAGVDDELLRQLQEEHEAAVRDHDVWGVPTFITDRRAVFVRLLDRPEGDAALARQRIAQIVDLVDDPLELHEFKQTDLPI
ncbi:MAG: protein-disulfide isomerase [Nitriliruptor sp.]|nr:MAG: protein-disulfide isomerase [Nitriliruptor sp.]